MRILEIAAALPDESGAQALKKQLVEAGTWIGANVEEGDGAVSRADKRKNFTIARKEARETRYWLTLVNRVWGKSVDVKGDLQEATELLYILSAIISKLES